MIDLIDRQLIDQLQKGLPLVSRPYALIGQQFNIAEDEVLSRLSRLKQQGLIKRVGVIVKHRQLGYKANAMVVFNVPDHLVEQIGEHVSQFAFVNLCYQRPRQGELWTYNLYCMIHGRNRDKVLGQLDHLIESCGLGQFDRDVLFSKQCFKQRGAVYSAAVQQCRRKSYLMDEIDKKIINHLQQGFPVCDSPYRVVALRLGLSEADLIVRITDLLESGVLTRFGPLYHAEQMGGALTLAAVKVPQQRFDRVAEMINSYPEVAHNYARNHDLNMWFVIATDKPEKIAEIIRDIEEKTGLSVYNMPKINEYFVNLKLRA